MSDNHSNFSTAIFLYNDKVKAVLCSYDPDDKENPGDPKSPPKTTLFKSFDETLKEGDLVIVPTGTRHRYTVVRVEKVGVEPNLETRAHVDWIVGPFDRSGHEKTIAQEAEVTQRIKDGQKVAKRREIAKQFFAGAEEANLQGLAIITVPAALPQPKED